MTVPAAVILAGGFGTRLRALHPECPKPLVLLAGRSFLEYVIEYLEGQGIREIVVSTGYRGDQIETHFCGKRFRASIQCVREMTVLGTGGAIAFAASRLLHGSWVLAVNGDSLVPFRLQALLAAADAGADAAMVGVQVTDPGRFGSLAIGPDGRLTGFCEKAHGESPAMINAGVYLLRRDLLSQAPTVQPLSMETDCFPQWLREGRRIGVIPSRGPLIDIGTPESLLEAEQLLKEPGSPFAGEVVSP